MLFNLTQNEKRIFDKLETPHKIQDFLNRLPMNFDYKCDTCRSPRNVIHVGRAHCIEGAFVAAAVLWHHGQKPFLMDLRTTKHDYDHVVALYNRNGFWGAISKTNHAVLRFRDPIYRTPRELALSYFHEYFLDNGLKTLREFSRPFDMSQFGASWVTSDGELWDIADKLDDSPHERIIPRGMERILRRADNIERKAGKLKEW